MRTTRKMQVEADANLEYNAGFRAMCESMKVLKKGFYGQVEIDYFRIPEVIKAWRKNHILWYRNTFEAGLAMAIDASPAFPGWESEKQEMEFLRKFRKINSCCNSEVEAFMRQYDPDWDF